MNSKAYLEELESLNEDFEPGLISELRMDAPDRLHASVMSEIRAQKKKRFYMNFKVYMPVAAAVLVAAMFINGGRNYIDQLYPEKPVKSAIVTPQTDNSITPSVKAVDPGKTGNPTIVNTPAEKSGKISSNITADKTGSKNNISVETAKPSATDKDNSINKSSDEKTVAMNTDISGKEITDNSSNTTQAPEIDSNINLEVKATSQSEVISFLKSYGTLADDGKNKIYKLNISYLDQFNTILETGTAEGKTVNGKVTGNDFIIKLVVEE